MERTHNLAVLGSDLAQSHDMNLAAQTLAKCTQSCFLSMKEDDLLPTEERCLRNCFIKSEEFNKFYEREFRYASRNLEQRA